MNEVEAIKAIESLRKGIPPDGHVRHFTVGRESEINQLVVRLREKHIGALLLKANYGSGKSHLLRFLRETALREGYAVSTVTLDAKSAVRFNRMDQIVGAIWRGLEMPGAPGERGIRPFFNLISKSIEDSRKRNDTQSFWYQLTNQWDGDFSASLDSPAFFVALRAWKFGGGAVHDMIQDWFFQPWVQTQRKLYSVVVEDLRRYFHDPRQDRQFYRDGVFAFDRQRYQQSWAVLRDAQKLALESGLKGFIILFDEFEDVLTNLNNISYQEAAFRNLFQFCSGKQFPGMTFFAVTPEFADKCKRRLREKGRWDYDYSGFEALPTFAMSPLEQTQLEVLALKIAAAHGIAYGWQPQSSMTAAQLKAVVAKAAAIQVQDRARHTIREVVTALDRLLEDDHRLGLCYEKARRVKRNYLEESEFTKPIIELSSRTNPDEWFALLADVMGNDGIAKLLGACRRQLEETPSHPGLLLLAGMCRTASARFQKGPQDVRTAFAVLRRTMPDEQARLAIAKELVAHAERLIPSRVDLIMDAILEGDGSTAMVRHCFVAAQTDSQTHHTAIILLAQSILKSVTK